MVDYTVTIGLVGERMKGLDNITNTTLTVEGTTIVDGVESHVSNDANNLIVRPNDTISWTLAQDISGTWMISNIPIGKKMGNMRTEGTDAMFKGATHKAVPAIPDDVGMRRIPANIDDVKFINLGNPTVIGALPTSPGDRRSLNMMSFLCRVYVQNRTDSNDFWWIDPEIDVCP